MSESLDRFIAMLLRSGLITEAQLDALRQQLSGDPNSGTEELFASKLADSGHLSDFQAQELRDGNIENLIVGDYVILQPVAKGGMGEVYRARHCVMKREVAVKFTLPNAEGKVTDAFVRRFQREVETASQLLHPNIVSSLDAGHRGEVCYLVMEFVQGTNLAKHVRKQGPMPFAQALDCIIQAAQGLEYAHRKGVVHRDIKPSNLILTVDGLIKILDMGLVRTTTPNDESQPTVEHEDDLTKTGHLLGTVDFMAPEQAIDPRTADARSDIYSLGCTLYYLLTGTAPYRLNTNATTMSSVIAHREKPIPSITANRKDVPESFQRIFAKMLNKQPEHRFQSASELLASLRKAQADLENEQAQISLTETRDYSPTVRSRKRTWFAVGLAAVLLVGGYAAWQSLPKTVPAGQSESQPPEDDKPITQKVNLLTSIDLDKAWSVGQDWKLADGLLTTPSTSPSKLHVPIFLPDAFQLTTRVKRIGASGPLALGVSDPKKKLHILVDASRKAGSMTALGSINGRLAQSVDNKLNLDTDRETELVLTVTPNSISLAADGTVVLDWKGNLKQLSLPVGWQVDNTPGIFVGSNDGASFIISQLEAQPLAPLP